MVIQELAACLESVKLQDGEVEAAHKGTAAPPVMSRVAVVVGSGGSGTPPFGLRLCIGPGWPATRVHQYTPPNRCFVLPGEKKVTSGRWLLEVVIVAVAALLQPQVLLQPAPGVDRYFHGRS